MSKRFYVTTPIYYVNDKPHIGHAYTTVLADTLARYHRMLGEQTHFVTGTDEHGQKVQEAADKRGVTPQAHVDELSQAFRGLWPDLHIANDDFIRTTEARHTKVVQAVLTRLYDAGDIYAKDYAGWYSTAAERFWTERDLVDGRCPDTGQAVTFITERNYFFRMSKYADALRAHIDANPGFIRPTHRANEVLGFLAKGVEDLCITRPKSRLAWGIEIPFDTDYVCYVWFDALLNYASAIGGVAGEGFDTWWSSAHHVIGKDILTTHSVYWTTMLFALGLPLPKSIIAHGWWLASDDAKMSKSLGNVVSPLGMKDVYGPDVFRYFLMRDMVVGLDARFDEGQLVRRNNSDLANDLGNLARRVAGLVGRWFDGRVPPPEGEASPQEQEVVAQADALVAAFPGYIERLELHTAIEETMQLVRRLNKFMTETAPFKTVKTDKATAGRALYVVLEGLRHAACLLEPVMPVKMVELLTAIGAAPVTNLDDLAWGRLPAGAPLVMETGLFPRRDMPEKAIEEDAVADVPAPKKGSGEAKTKKAKKKAEAPETPGVIDFDAFMAVELRAATVLEATRVEGSDRLLKLQVDLGTEQRQVVSGIAEHIAPESLPGTQVVLVANLAPRKIFKLESQGMILAVDTPDGGLRLVRPDGAVPPGARVR